MTKPKKSYKHSRNARSSSVMLLAVGLWCIGMFASMGMLVPLQVYAQSGDSIPGGDVGNPAIRGMDIAKPAVVRILTDVPGHLVVHFPPTTDVSFPQQSNGNYQLAFTGAGTFISPQGDVLTTDRLVEPPQDQVLNPALYSAAAQDVANYMNAQAGATPVSANDVVQQLTSGKLSSTPSYDSPTSRVYLSTDYAGAYTASDLNSVPSNLKATVDKIEASSPFDQNDLAIVHVPMTDMPSVTLGNSDNVQMQDQLTVIGFPNNGDVNAKPQAFLTLSTSSVSVSAKRTGESGAPLFQIDRQIDNGNEGGPALNNQGEIVGVVSLANGNGNSGKGTSLLQSSSSALKLAQSISLDMTPGSFQKLWSQAFEDFAATTTGHWHKAEQEFTQLAQSYQQFQAVQPFLTYAQTQAQTESLVTATPTQVQHRSSNPAPSAAGAFGLAAWQLWAIVIAAAVLLLVLVVSVFAASVRRRKRRNGFRPDVVGVKDVSTIVKPKPSESVAGQSPALGGVGQSTLALKIWPCGHMNRPNARFCSICGEAAPTEPGQGG